MELKQIKAIDLPIETQEQVEDKIIALKRLENEVESKYAEVLEKIRKIREEKAELDAQITSALEEATNKALTFDDFPGVKVVKTTSYSYDEEKLSAHPAKDEFFELKLSKTKVKKYVKEHGEVDGFAEVKGETKRLDVSRMLLEQTSREIE